MNHLGQWFEFRPYHIFLTFVEEFLFSIMEGFQSSLPSSCAGAFILIDFGEEFSWCRVVFKVLLCLIDDVEVSLESCRLKMATALDDDYRLDIN